MLQTTVASVNSGLQRARVAVRARVGPRTQQQALRSLGDGGLQLLVERYVKTWERNDVMHACVSTAEQAMGPAPSPTRMSSVRPLGYYLIDSAVYKSCTWNRLTG